MIRLRPLIVLLLAGLPSALLADSAPPAPFAAGDRWVALGDSITHFGTYPTDVLMYYVTRFPDHKIDEVNAGISGDSAAGALLRVNWDVLIHHPTVVSIMLGMNDVNRALYGKPGSAQTDAAKKAAIEAYKRNMADLVDAIQASGAKVILIQPSPFDETVDLPGVPRLEGVNGAIGQCAQYLTQLASETGASLVDFYDPMNAASRAVQAADPKATIIGKDRIHPGAPGHFLMGYSFLKAQGVPAEVAHATIDAPHKSADSGNSTVSEVRIIKGGITFTWDERALPYPIDPSCAPALAWVPFVQDLDQEELTVLGLNPGATYALSIDGTPIRTYTAEELAHGVNLATQTQTPQYQQALAVARALMDRNDLIRDKIRAIALIEAKSAPRIEHPVTPEQMAPFIQTWVRKQGPQINAKYKAAAENYPDYKNREAELVAQAASYLDQAYALAVPKPHTYKIVLVR